MTELNIGAVSDRAATNLLMKKPKPSALEVLDTLSHHIAEAAAKRPREPTEEERRWSQALGDAVNARLDELRRKARATRKIPPME